MATAGLTRPSDEALGELTVAVRLSDLVALTQGEGNGKVPPIVTPSLPIEVRGPGRPRKLIPVPIGLFEEILPIMKSVRPDIVEELDSFLARRKEEDRHRSEEKARRRSKRDTLQRRRRIDVMEA